MVNMPRPGPGECQGSLNFKAGSSVPHATCITVLKATTSMALVDHYTERHRWHVVSTLGTFQSRGQDSMGHVNVNVQSHLKCPLFLSSLSPPYRDGCPPNFSRPLDSTDIPSSNVNLPSVKRLSGALHYPASLWGLTEWNGCCSSTSRSSLIFTKILGVHKLRTKLHKYSSGCLLSHARRY